MSAAWPDKDDAFSPPHLTYFKNRTNNSLTTLCPTKIQYKWYMFYEPPMTFTILILGQQLVAAYIK